MQKYLIFTALLFISVLSKSQTTNDSLPLNLQKLISLSIENNIKLRNANYEQKKLNYQITEVRSSSLPQVNFTGTYERYLKLPTMLLPGEIIGGEPGSTIPVQMGTNHNLTGSIEASQVLFNQSVFVAVELAKKILSQNSLNIEKLKYEVVYDVARIYYMTLIIKEQRKNAIENTSRFEKLKKVTENQYKNGFIKKVDLDRIEVTLNNLQTEIDNYNMLFQQQVNLLKYFCGLDFSKNVQINDSISYKQNIDLQNQGIDNHIDMQILTKQKEISDMNLKLNYSSYYPSLALFARYSVQSQENSFRFFEKEATWFKTAVVGINLTIPVFDGFQKSSKVRQAKINSDQIADAIADTRKYLDMEIKNATTKLLNNQKTYDVQSKNVNLAKQVYFITLEQYQKGVTPLTDLLNAETALKDAQTNMLNSLCQIYIAELDLMKANGTIYKLIK